jgi:hypothetical protein
MLLTGFAFKNKFSRKCETNSFLTLFQHPPPPSHGTLAPNFFLTSSTALSDGYTGCKKLIDTNSTNERTR